MGESGGGFAGQTPIRVVPDAVEERKDVVTCRFHFADRQ